MSIILAIPSKGRMKDDAVLASQKPVLKCCRPRTPAPTAHR